MGRRGGGHGGFLFPQAETELSGLCDDDNGGASPVEAAPWREPATPWPTSGGPPAPCEGRIT